MNHYGPNDAAGSAPSSGTAPMDPALIRGLTQRRLSRRTLLRSAGVAAGAIGLASVLDACSVSSSGSSNTSVNWTSFWADHAKPNGTLNFANWPIYIDHVQGSNGGAHPSLDYFQEKTGIEVRYRPVINENASFFATIEPSLQAGKDTGWDLMVISSGTLEQLELFDNGWLIPLDQSAMTNFNKYASDKAKDPPYDPGNKYTMAWQSGFTGIGVNTKYIDPSKDFMTPGKASWRDLFNPRWKGKVGMFADADEIGSAALLVNGVEPAQSTPQEWQQAADLLKKQNDDGIVRAYYEQGYITKLQDGDTWISQAWSGDVLTSQLLGYPELQFFMPAEGAMYWTDTMMIPLHASNPRDAMTYMDFVYDPFEQAMIDDWVWYLSPVPKAQEVLRAYVDEGKDFPEGLAPNKAVADSPIVFPTPDLWSQTREYYTFKSIEDAQRWNSVFQPVFQS
jgi:spermidine/putrescine transport system substrate-binding protein